MKIGIIGWYGHNNYGDERMLYCIKTFFSEHNFFTLGNWEDVESKMDEFNKCDYIFIGGGGIIYRKMDYQLSLVKRFKRPFSLIGVSVEGYHRDMSEFMGFVKDRAEFILVRDKQSKKYFNNHYKVIVGPDLTFLYPFELSKETKQNTCGFNLRDWYYWKAAWRGWYDNVMVCLNKKHTQLKKFYPFPKWEPSKVVDIVKKNFDQVLPVPLYFGSEARNDKDLLLSYFEKTPTSFDPSSYNDIRFLIGMRYHSLVFAIQYGIPFISLSYQPKNISLLTDLDLKMLSVDIFKSRDLEQKIDYVKNHYVTIRNHLISYRHQSIDDIRRIFNSIKKVL